MENFNVVICNGTEVSDNEIIDTITRVSKPYGYQDKIFKAYATIENGDLKIQVDFFDLDQFNKNLRGYRFRLYLQGLDGDCIYTTEDGENLINENQFDYVIESLYNVGEENPILERQLGDNGKSILKMMLWTDCPNN